MVDKRLAYMTPEWKDAFKYATQLADQLGLEEAIAGSPGWSESGGPWVPARKGMKKYVWSETRRRRRQAVQRACWRIRRPIPAHSRTSGVRDAARLRRRAAHIPQFYADAAVVAYTRPASRSSARVAAAEDHLQRRTLDRRC